MSDDALVIVRGGGDLGTGVAHRLARAGYRVLVLETERPLVVRRAAAFAEAVFEGRTNVEGVPAVRVDLDALAAARSDERGGDAGWPRWVPVIIDPDGAAIGRLAPDAIVDARMRKLPPEAGAPDGVLSIGLGPGLSAGPDVDLVIETYRGNALGRVIERGEAAADTGVPGEILGRGAERVLRAPADGTFESIRTIGDLVGEGETIGRVGADAVSTRIAGLVRGLIADGTGVREGMKIGDIDPRGAAIDPAEISDKARAVGGGVLEALLSRRVLPGGRIYGV